MDAKLYVLMDWAAVEELVYSESVSYTHLDVYKRQEWQDS